MTCSSRAPVIRRWMMTLLCTLLADGLGGQTITEFSVPTNPPSRPSIYQLLSIAAGPDGALWFTEENAGKIGRITTSGGITEFPVPQTPVHIAAGSDGALWFTETSRIGRITTAGQITEFNVPTAGFPSGITAGPDGALWFTEADRIGRISTAGVVAEFAVPTCVKTGCELSGITAGPDGALWFIELAYLTGGVNKIGRITTAGVIDEFPIPTGHVPTKIASGPDGALWFTEEASSKIGRMTTAGVVTEFNVPTAGFPSGITAGQDGAMWFTDSGANKIGRITTSGAVTGIFAIPTDGAAFAITAGPDGALWFLESLGNKIGRLTPPLGACRSDATTLCLNNGRFRARTQWTTPQGSSGLGQGVALTEDSGYFWFFSDNNVEMIVKVLNGCNINSRVWTFAGGLTNVQVVMTVEDTQTGAVRTYTNPQGAAFQPIEDTAAFESCPTISGSGAMRSAKHTKAPADPQTKAQQPASSVTPAYAGSELFPCHRTFGPTLCLNLGRFTVETSWSTPDGMSGPGQAVRLTVDSGYFWFFSPNNVELMVKVSDACDFNSRFWVFAGGVTNVKVLMTVTNNQTGVVRTYTSSQGSPFEPIQDTDAFATCP